MELREGVYKRSDLVNADGTPTTVIVSAMAQVQLERLKDAASSFAYLEAELSGVTEADAQQHIDDVFALYDATVKYLLLDTSKESHMVIKTVTKPILDRLAEDIGIPMDMILPSLEGLVTSAKELAAEFVESDNFADYVANHTVAEINE